MSELELDGRYASRVRIEITTNDGITYEIEMANCEKAGLGLEYDSAVVPSEQPWVVREPTGYADVQLKAFGRIVRQERRQE